MDESALWIDSGLVDLANVPLKTLDAFDDRALDISVERLLTQVDRSSNSAAGHNS